MKHKGSARLDNDRRAAARQRVNPRRRRTARRSSPWPVFVLPPLFLAWIGAVGWWLFGTDSPETPDPVAAAAGSASLSVFRERAAPDVGRVAVPAALDLAPEAPAASAESAPEIPVEGPLARFFAAVQAMRRGARRESVRVLWLGDSHTAADFWPDAVRRPLSERYGAGGPGYLFLGLPDYRHSGVRISRAGPWRALPHQPALARRTEDGVFGLGGVRAIAGGPDAILKVTIQRESIRGDAMWDLAFRLPDERAGFRVQGEGMAPVLVDGTTFPARTIQHVAWRTVAPITVTLDGMEGAVEFFGVVVQGTKPGIVIDTAGINGARVATPLVWDEAAWVAEVRRRNPTLVVIAYGTNETGDGVPPDKYALQYRSLLGRVRSAAPEVDCLIAGPTDREGLGVVPGRVKQITAVQERVARELGCAFFSTQEAMGGEGGFSHWAEVSGTLTSADGVHLAPEGYSELGAQMVRVLLSPRPGLK